MLLFGMDFFFVFYSYFLGWELKLCPHSQYRVSVYTLFIKQRIRKFNFHSYVLNLVKISISFFLSKFGSHGVDLSCTISSANLLDKRARIVEWSGSIYQPNCSEKVKYASAIYQYFIVLKERLRVYLEVLFHMNVFVLITN